MNLESSTGLRQRLKMFLDEGYFIPIISLSDIRLWGSKNCVEIWVLDKDIWAWKEYDLTIENAEKLMRNLKLFLEMVEGVENEYNADR